MINTSKIDYQPRNLTTPLGFSIRIHDSCKDSNYEPDQYWILFTGQETGGNFLHRVLKKGFWHTCILMKKENIWYILDPTCYGLQIEVLSYTPEIDVPRVLKMNWNARVIKIEKRHNFKRAYRLISCIYCVNIVKFILGLHVFCVTPYQLYKKLNKMSKNSNQQIKVLI